MEIIQCAEKCKFQRDGYCSLDKMSVINSVTESCPFFVADLFDNRKSFFEASDTDKF